MKFMTSTFKYVIIAEMMKAMHWTETQRKECLYFSFVHWHFNTDLGVVLATPKLLLSLSISNLSLSTFPGRGSAGGSKPCPPGHACRGKQEGQAVEGSRSPLCHCSTHRTALRVRREVWMVTALLSSSPLELEGSWKDKVSPVLFALVPLWFLLLSPSSEGKHLPWCVSPYGRIFFWFLRGQGDANQVLALWYWDTSCFSCYCWSTVCFGVVGLTLCMVELVSPPGVKAYPK